MLSIDSRPAWAVAKPARISSEPATWMSWKPTPPPSPAASRSVGMAVHASGGGQVGRRGQAAVGRGWSGEPRLGGDVATPPARPAESVRDGLVVDFYNGAGRSGPRPRATRRQQRSG